MKALALCLLCSPVFAQTYDYSGGLTGSILLSAPLSANLNNQTVVPLSYDFAITSSDSPYPSTASFVFSTDANSNITGWDVEVSTNSGGVVNTFYQSASSTTTGDSYSSYALASDCGGPSASSQCAPVQETFAPGHWTAVTNNAAMAAPEIKPGGAIGAFLLLGFGLAWVRGRK